jgi:preprotein translocase subunit YajC
MAAEGPAPGPQGGITGLLLPIALFIGIFYFMIFRPQKKKQQQHDNMISSIARGDTVISAGGFFGRVCDILEDSYVIEIADGVKVRILKSSISTRKDSADNPKPLRHKRKKKRREPVDQGGAPAENEKTAEDSVPAAIEDWVTNEESDILFKESNGGTKKKAGDSTPPAEIVADEEQGEQKEEEKNKI